MQGNGRPALWLLAGADGVGKTTYARARITAVAGSTEFINLDLIGQGLSSLDPSRQQFRAARVALDMARDLIRQRTSFSLETTLSGLTHLRLIETAKSSGMAVKLLYFFVRSPEECLRRVARRVAEGGHDAPETDLRRRYDRSLRNFAAYAATCDFWCVHDANGLAPLTIAEGEQSAVHHDTGKMVPDALAGFIRAANLCL